MSGPYSFTGEFYQALDPTQFLPENRREHFLTDFMIPEVP